MNDERSVTSTKTIEAEPDAVWDAFTTDDGFAAWNGEGASIEAVPGGRVASPDPATGVERVGAVEHLAPPSSIRYRWWPIDDPDQVSTVEVTLDPTEEGTAITVVERLVLAPAPSASVGRGPLLLAA